MVPARSLSSSEVRPASGIGLATARLLVDMGARVTITGRDAERGARASQELGERAHYARMDVARADQVAAAIDDSVQRWGRLDWAVNAAALADTPFARIADITEEDWDRTLAVDLKGVWLAMKYELAAMLGTGGGSIVNVSSVNGLSATPQAGAYCVAKHGLHGLTKTAAAEYAAQSIRINVVCSGAHLTPMLEVVFDRLAPGAPDKAAAMYRARCAPRTRQKPQFDTAERPAGPDRGRRRQRRTASRRRLAVADRRRTHA